jgi:Lar family restriction alleviation protein
MNDEQIQGSENERDPAPVHREVLPCPFCGETSIEFVVENYQWCKINCLGCGAYGGTVRRFQLDRHGNTILSQDDAQERALAEWNRRQGKAWATQAEHCMQAILEAHERLDRDGLARALSGMRVLLGK